MTKEKLYLIKLPLLIFLLTPILLYFTESFYLFLFSFIVSYFLFYLIGCNLYHRYWSHKQMALDKKVEFVTTILGLFSMVGDPLNYAKTHRWHHLHTDTDKDPHSPIHGRWHAFVGWMFKPRQQVPPFVIKDLLKPEFKYLQSIGTHQIKIVWATLIVAGLISVDILSGMMLAMCLAFIFEMLVNAVSHDPLTKEIKNIKWLSYITMSSYHGFHHQHPGTIDRKDPAFYILNLIKK